MGDIARSMPRISVKLEIRKANNQTSMVEGILNDKQISSMIKLKTNERTYLFGKIKDMKILNIKRKVLSFIRTLGIIIGDTKGKFLKMINSRILQE